MRALDSFIVKLPKKFKDTIKVGGKELYLASKFDEFKNRITSGEIISTPKKYETGAKPGDTLYFHHHIVLDAKLHLGDDHYIVSYVPEGGMGSQSYAYKNEDGFRVFNGWVFAKQVETADEQISSSGIVISIEKEERNEAEVVHICKEYTDVTVGDVVGYRSNADYEIDIDGEMLLRMRTEDMVYAKTS